MSGRAETRVVGRRLPLVDGAEKVTGATLYIPDLKLPGMLAGKILRSPHPHARIVHVDASAAERLPGVRAVLTGRNTSPTRFGINKPDETAFCREKVRFVADEVAAVAAEDEATAEEALSLIRVEYEELPPLLDPFAALAGGAPLVHEDAPGNVAYGFRISRGDPGAGFRAAEATFEEEFHTHLAHQAYIEPTGCVGEWHEGGRLTLWAPLQSVFVVRTYMLAPVLQMSPEDIRVIQTKPGGAFGGKLDVKLLLIVALLARAARRPVRVQMSLSEDLISMRPRMPTHIRLRSGFKRDGTLLAKRVEVVADNGAYSSLSPSIMSSLALRTDCLYRTPSVEVDAKLVYTNTEPTGQMRGFGNVQATFAWESHMDTAARGLGLDPLELRLKNYTQLGDTTVHGWRIVSCGVSETARKAAAAIGWSGKRGRGGGRGVGLASTIHVTSNKGFAVALGPDDREPSTSLVRVGKDGRVEVWSGESDLGEGATTVMALVAAEELGLPYEDIRVPPTDTGCMPFGFGAFASRLTFMAGHATRLAAKEARGALLAAAAELLEADPAEIVVEGREVYVRGLPSRRASVSEVVKSTGREAIEGSGTYEAGGDVLDPKTKYGSPATTYSFATHAAEVEVDGETGVVRVLKVAAAHDLGRVINPLGAEGQVEGGAAQGMGYCLMEHLAHKGGRILGANFHDYLVPTSLDAPPVEVEFVETIDPTGPYGAKGVAETAINPTAAAIANAIFDAVGARVRSLPITPERVLEAMEEGEGGGKGR